MCQGIPTSELARAETGASAVMRVTNRMGCGMPTSLQPPVTHNERRDRVERLMTVEEAADTLACEASTIRKWLSQGRLPRVKVGRLTRLRARDVADVVAHGLPERRSCGRSPLA